MISSASLTTSRHDAAIVRSKLAALLGVALIACGLLSGCFSGRIERVSDKDELRQFGFLKSGEVSRSDIEHRLGRPDAIYEGGRIVTYMLRKRKNHFEVVAAPTGSGVKDYRLVLVFRSDDLLDQWSLIDRSRYREQP
jgi:sulfite exporter TauE/SafE